MTLPSNLRRFARVATPDRPACWCLAVPLDIVEDQPPIEERELATLDEIAILETERAHGRCGLPAPRLEVLSRALARPAHDAYVEGRINGLCEEGATEVFRDVLAGALRSAPRPD